MLDATLQKLQMSTDTAIMLYMNADDTICCSTSSSGEFAHLVALLNELKLLDQSIGKGDELDAKVAYLIKELQPLAAKLIDMCSMDESTRDFLRLVSLLFANGKVNDLIKQEMSTEVIDEICVLYLGTLDTLRYMQHNRGVLISNVSLISPLLITISFSFRLMYKQSDSLMKILSILFVFHLQHKELLQTTIDLFCINASTNMEVFEVFNKLWEKTLQLPNGDSFESKRLPGPVSTLNKIFLLREYPMSLELLDHVFPYQSNQMLLRCSKEVVSIYSALLSLRSNPDTSVLLTIISLLQNDLSCEVMVGLIDVMEMDSLLLSLYDSKSEFRSAIEFILFKISGNIDLSDPRIQMKFVSKIFKTEVLDALDESIYARYKVIFELVDHNYKIDFAKDFQMSMLLEQSLSTIDSQFELIQDHDVLAQYGSIYCMESLFTYANFIINKSILGFMNPKRELPREFLYTMDLKRFAPLPRSNFTDISLESIPLAQINAKNINKLINSSLLCLSVVNTVVKKYFESKGSLNMSVHIGETDSHLEYRCMDSLLKLHFTSLFTALIISNELCTRARDSPSSFFEYEPPAKIMRLKVFQLFENLFQLYGDFAIYLLVRFVTMASMHDLILQELSLQLLNHLTFHCKNDLKDAIIGNDMISGMVKAFVTKWDDGSERYKEFNSLLRLSRAAMKQVPFDRLKYLKQLGYEVELLSSSSNNSMRFDMPSAQPFNQSFTTNKSIKKQTMNNQQSLNIGHNQTYTHMNNMYVNSSSPITNLNNNMNMNMNMHTQYQQKHMSEDPGYNYKTSNLNNVMSFVPQQQNYGN